MIVPGLFILKRYYLAAYYLIDEDLDITEAMRRSAADSKRYSSAVWGILGAQLLFAACLIIPILGFIAALVLLAMYANAPAIRYLEFKASRQPADKA